MPDINNSESIAVFGKPKLFFGVTGGNVDSVLSRYTSFLKIRNDDPYHPVDSEYERPVRSVITFSNLIRQQYKDVPIIIGGIEASMRRLAHFDYLSSKIRRSILLDSRADLLVYGMGEKPIVTVAKRLQNEEGLNEISGTLIVQKELPAGGYHTLPDEQLVINDKALYTSFYKELCQNSDKVLVQMSGKRYLVQNPMALYSSEDLDSIYKLNFSYSPAKKYKTKRIPAYDMIVRSINSHRGCASGCAFCSIALHQGRTIVSRSEQSVLDEAKRLVKMSHKDVHITDVGGPSANMYGTICTSKKRCLRESCLYPDVCRNLKVDTKRWLRLLKKVRSLEGVKNVTVGSGIRYDLFMRDCSEGLAELIDNYISGQLKIAPEHISPHVLKIMRKQPVYNLEKFITDFKTARTVKSKKRYLLPYLMSNHPGSKKNDMLKMRNEIRRLFGFIPKQVQSFFPLPLTLSSVIYWTGIDPFTGEKVYSEKDMNKKREQHSVFFDKKLSKK